MCTYIRYHIRVEIMPFEWNDEKNRENLAKHGIDFDTAELVFADPFALTQRDVLHDEDEERYITLGAIGAGAVVFVVHTSIERDGEDVVQLISARSATGREKQAYEEAHKRTEAKNRKDRGKKRRGH
jgi:uncharacterized DUF497 family protein